MLPDNSFFEYVKALSPAKIDLEIRSLLSLEHLELFLRSRSSTVERYFDHTFGSVDGERRAEGCVGGTAR
jgi:hypothetical protein